jgi:hypothetical protein
MRPAEEGAVLPTRTDAAAATLGLRDMARVHEIDRRLYSIRLARTGLKWVVFPGVGVLGALTLHGVLEALAIGVPTAADVLGGAFILLTAAAGYLQSSGQCREEEANLEAERSSIAARESHLEYTRIPSL